MKPEMDLISEIERWGKGPMFLSDTPRVKVVLLRALARIRELERAQPAGEAVAWRRSAYPDDVRVTKVERDAWIEAGWEVEPLYAAPPAAANQAGIPAGYVLVPKEPTPEIIERFRNKYPLIDVDADDFRTDYALVIAAAAPESHALGGDGEKGRNDE